MNEQLAKSGQEQEPFETHCVIELAPKCTDELVQWIVRRIRNPKAAGGAEFLVKTVKDISTNRITHLHINAPTYRLMEIAEWLEIMKPDLVDGVLREFSLKALSRFIPDENVNDAKFFSNAEESRMVNFEINELRAQDGELDRFLESNKVRFGLGQSIITKLQRRNLIVRIFPLHDKESRKRLASEWYKVSLFKNQPIEEIRNYFGEHIAVYFAFLGFYTEMLVPAAALGLAMFLVQYVSTVSLSGTCAFAIFNILWTSVFFERWKRYCNRIAYGWGTLNKSLDDLEIPRAQFKGEMGTNPVTGQPEPVYPIFARNLWIAFVSTPVVTLCLFTSIYIVGTYLNTQLHLNILYAEKPTVWLFFLKFVPSAVYTLCISTCRTVYRHVATWLTDKENHRLQTSYEFHLIWKLLLFNFINSFASLFYIAFWLQDIPLLRSILAAQLITNQFINHFPETVLPYIKVTLNKWKTKQELRREDEKREAQGEFDEDPNFEEYRKQAIVEGGQPKYSGTFDDYLEMFLQFGYCFLFSSAYPLAAVFAFLNNVIEIRSDGFKLCNVMQRTFAVPAHSIGPWQLAFELMGFAAITTNLALVYTNPIIRDYFPYVSNYNLLLAFVCVEHILIFAKLGLSSLIPTVPREIQLSMARTEYERKKAIKDKRAEETRKELELRRSVTHVY